MTMLKPTVQYLANGSYIHMYYISWASCSLFLNSILFSYQFITNVLFVHVALSNYF